MNNKDEIMKILIDGSNRAQEIADEVLIEIKKIIGINFKDWKNNCQRIYNNYVYTNRRNT